MSVLEPTVPVIVYLHADRLVPRHSHLSDGTHVPCSDHAVETKALATLLFASALWSLREQRVVSLEVAPAAHEAVRLAPLRPAPRPGLEGALVENLAGEEPLREVVCRWSAARSTDPWHDGVHEVAAEAVAGGYLHEIEPRGGMLARLLARGPELEPDCTRIRALEPSFEAFERAWERFRHDEQGVCDALLEDSRRALEAATECWYP